MKHDGISNHQAFFFDEVFVIEGGSLNQTSRDADGLKNRVGSDSSRTSYRQHDIQKFRGYLFWGEFISDGPFRGLCRIADYIIQIDVIDFIN